MSDIKLSNILKIDNPKHYKVHCAVYNQKDYPLDDFVRGKWESWNSYKGEKNEFNRRYIFSLMNFHHDRENDAWLFGGVFEVLSDAGEQYKIKLTTQHSEFIGRLKLKFKLVGRNRRLKMENCYSKFVVSEVFKEKYSGSVFPGYEKIDIDFNQLSEIIKNQKNDWYAALKNVKGVYLITDQSNGLKYVGSAYGEDGIWSRWAEYVKTGHGKNVELKLLVNERGLDHVRQNFRFALLEYRPARVDDQIIIEREMFWKSVLLARDFGFNKN